MPAAALALGAMAGTAIGGIANALSTHFANKSNVSAQKSVNAQQLDFAKNAYSYAAADRMRAGLSPLDTQAASAPQLTAPTVSPVDYGFIGDVAARSISVAQNQQQIDTNRDAVNASVAKSNAETQSILIDNLTRYQNNLLHMLDKYKDIEHKSDVHDTYAEQALAEIEKTRKQIEMTQKQIEEITASIDNIRAQTRSVTASAVEKESQNDWSTALRVPPSLLKSVAAGDAQSMLIYNGLLSQWQKRQSVNNTPEDLQASYRVYLDNYNKAKAELENDIKRYNMSWHTGKAPENYPTWQDYRQSLADRNKSLRKPLSFKEFSSRILD